MSSPYNPGGARAQYTPQHTNTMTASQSQVSSGNILAASAKLRKKHPSPRGTEVSMKQAAMKMNSGSNQQLQHMHANQ